MKIIVCMDDRNGMLFNKRRQSTDSAVRKRVLSLAGDNKLWMNAYSAKQFSEETGNIIVDEEFLRRAGSADYCFVENTDLVPYLQDIDTVVIYRWNRAYPSDVKFPVKIFEMRWKLVKSFDFAGSSHGRITEEVYAL